MNKLRFSILALCVLSSLSHAQVYSPTVGFNTITALGNSDTRVSAPLHRSPAFSGMVQSVTGNIITVQGLPGWTANQFAYLAGTQPNSYYVSITSGNKEGMYYTVTGNSNDSGTTNTSTVTVNPDGDVLDGASGISQGDTLLIVPYWTLSTFFPGQIGITSTTNIFGTGALTQILLIDATAIGKNLAATHTYYYFTGSGNGGPGWRRVGGGFANIKNDDVILPDAPIIVRQNNVATSQITITGNVPTSDRKYVIGTLVANTVQDNMIAVDLPVPLSLSQSNLFESGAFTGTTNIFGTTGDQLLVFNDATTGYNKAADSTYYYFTGATNGGPGWRKIGGGFTTIRNSDIVFQPGSGYVIRKSATVSPTSTVWTVPLTY
jgi:uncharacterized protein (TIGR02597 family)